MIKRSIAAILLFGPLFFSSAAEVQLAEKNGAIPCKKAADLTQSISKQLHPERTLLQIAHLAQKIEVDPEEFTKNSNYRKLCHLRIVKSENFGDFVTYDGYHYRKILKEHSGSDLVDDAAYELIYVISEDTYNYEDIEREKEKLLQFLEKYPKSNRASDAKTRVSEIEEILKRGGPSIYD